MDDIGASTKRYEVYSNFRLGLGPLTLLSGNWLFLKYIPPFRRWGPYRELKADEWRQILALLEDFDAKMTVGVTAAWVEADGSLTPFPEKFPEQSAVLKAGAKQGFLEIANHGLTHCVLDGGAFLPKAFAGNRREHREFWDWLPETVHEGHIKKAQAIFESWLGETVTCFIPPGNVFAEKTLAAARRNGLITVSCNTETRLADGLMIIGDEHITSFHDRDIVVNGMDWFRRLLMEHQGKPYAFVSETAKTLPNQQAKAI